MTQKLYTPSSVEEFIDKYSDMYDVYLELEPGSLTGIGTTVMVAPDDRHYNFVFQEVYKTCYSSAIKKRRYRKLPQKYVKMIDDWYKKQEEEEWANV